MLPARIFLLIGVVFGAATEVLGGPVMSSWAHRRDEISTNDSRTRGLSRYLNRQNTRLEGYGDLDDTMTNELHETHDLLPNIAPDPLPEQLQWVGLAARNAYLQSKQLDVNAEKASDLERARFDWNFNRL